MIFHKKGFLYLFAQISSKSYFVCSFIFLAIIDRKNSISKFFEAVNRSINLKAFVDFKSNSRGCFHAV